MADTQLSRSKVLYKEIVDFPGYRIGNDGSVWTCKQKVPKKVSRGWQWVLSDEWRELKAKPNAGNGYLIIGFRRDGKRIWRHVHILVLEAFVGPRPNRCQGCHNDGNKLNCAVSNLRWDTPAGNCADKIRHGTHYSGETHPLSKLTLRQVAMIRGHTFRHGDVMAFARRFGVSDATIIAIRERKSWKSA